MADYFLFGVFFFFFFYKSVMNDGLVHYKVIPFLLKKNNCMGHVNRPPPLSQVNVILLNHNP